MKHKIFTTFFIALALVTSVSFVRAQVNVEVNGPPAPGQLTYNGFVKCDGVVKDGEPYRTRQCDFVALMDTVVSLINWMFVISVPVAVVLFAYGGLLYITGVQKNIGTAKSIFTSVGIGFIIMIVAWIGVRTFVGWIVEDPTATIFLGQ